VLTVLLIRHASCDHVGRRIAGRAPGTHLNARGRAEAERLGRCLSTRHGQNSPYNVAALYCGPLERARETADTLGGILGIPVQQAAGFDEMDFGEWTGRTLEELDADPRWRAFNTARAATCIPGGEHMSAAVDRAVAELGRLERRHPAATIGAVSHCDIIRGILLRCLGVGLDDVHRLEIAPASVSILEFAEGVPRRVLVVNWTPHLSAE
jgi:broad specificity phosphatase PhoE